MKYFVTSLSPSKNMGTMNWQTMILDKHRVEDSYWENAKLEFYSKKAKRNDGSGDDIILSLPVSITLETIKSDFPNANVWVYK